MTKRERIPTKLNHGHPLIKPEDGINSKALQLNHLHNKHPRDTNWQLGRWKLEKNRGLVGNQK